MTPETDPAHGGKIGCENCTSLEIIGISDGDSIGYWQCRSCGHEWPRAGFFAEQARKNIDRDRIAEKERSKP